MPRTSGATVELQETPGGHSWVIVCERHALASGGYFGETDEEDALARRMAEREAETHNRRLHPVHL
jgi:hypothetical protein